MRTTTFQQQTRLEPDEDLYLVGSAEVLGKWDLNRSLCLEKTRVAPDVDRFNAIVTVEHEESLDGTEYKYVVCCRVPVDPPPPTMSTAKATNSVIGHDDDDEYDDAVSHHEEDVEESQGEAPVEYRMEPRRWIPEFPMPNLRVCGDAMDDRRVVVRFKMYRELRQDQSLYVYGSCLALGLWDRARAIRLEWSEGHRWTKDVSIPREELLGSDPVEYKFFEASHEDPQKGEEDGISIESMMNRSMVVSEMDLDRSGELEVYNAWNGTMMRLILFHPLPEGRIMAVVGGHEQIGNWSGPRPMGWGPSRKLLTGEIGQCWELTFPLREKEYLTDVQYRYASLNVADGTGIYEREPNRVRDFPNIKEINMGMHVVWDANFVGGIDYDEISDWNIVIGPYPQSREDVETLARQEDPIRAIINVQTERDFEHRRINWKEISQAYAENDIWVGRIPIVDFDGEDLQKHLGEAVQELHHFVSSGRKTYVHCTAGMGRAPAVVVAYAVKYRDMDPDAALAYIKQFRRVAAPNMSAVHQALREGRV